MIWLLTDLMTAFTMPFVWMAATKSSGGPIAGYSGADFVAYYVAMLFLTNFITCHFMWDMNFEIREGILSTQLMRPVNWMHFMFVRNLAWRVMRTGLFIPWFLLFLVVFGAQMGQVNYQFNLLFFVSLVLGHVLSFVFVIAIGCVALFTEEAQSVFELYYFPLMFLSGQMFPVAVLPDWAQRLALIFPFYYTTGVPTEILIGRLSGSAAWQAVGIQVVWTVVAYGLYRFLWPRGLKRYTGVGM